MVKPSSVAGRGALGAATVALVVTYAIIASRMAEPARWIGHFDMLALSSQSEQAPIAVIEAMAAALPVVSPNVGDVSSMVSDENRRFIATDEAAFRGALAELAMNAELRVQTGAANRCVAAERFAESTMVAAYENLYGRALRGRRLFSGD